MTSIAVKLEQRIKQLHKDKYQETPEKMNYVKHYLNYIIVRAVFRGIFTLVGKLMINPGTSSLKVHIDSLKLSLYIFAAVSLYFSIHALCCFDELKVEVA